MLMCLLATTRLWIQKYINYGSKAFRVSYINSILLNENNKEIFSIGF